MLFESMQMCVCVCVHIYVIYLLNDPAGYHVHMEPLDSLIKMQDSQGNSEYSKSA